VLHKADTDWIKRYTTMVRRERNQTKGVSDEDRAGWFEGGKSQKMDKEN